MAGRADTPRESVFGSQLLEAIHERKGQSKDAGAGDDKSKDAQTQPLVIADIVAAVMPMPLPGAFGLPTAGIEPGQSNDTAAAQQESLPLLPTDASASQ